MSWLAELLEVISAHHDPVFLVSFGVHKLKTGLTWIESYKTCFLKLKFENDEVKESKKSFGYNLDMLNIACTELVQ